MPLSTPIAQLPRMQPQIAKRFAQLGILTLRDALFTFPFRHEDWRRRATIDSLAVGQEVTLLVVVTTISSRQAWHRRGTSITDVTVTDDSQAKLHVLWFNMPFLKKSLKVGDRLYLSGTVVRAKSGRLQMANPVYERPTDDPLHERLVPIYRTTEGLSQRQIRLVMKQAVALAHVVPDPLPTETRTEWQLPELSEALANIHFPTTPEDAVRAVERLKFDELLAWRLRIAVAERQQARRLAPTIPFHEAEIRSFVQHLPYELTNDQRVAAWQVLQDLVKPQPMSRLVQGDVGSGKTVVAALVAYNVALSHLQVAFVAPTVVLAEQHWSTMVATLGKFDVRLGLLTGSVARIHASGSTAEVTDRQLLEAVAEGSVTILVGTHAILQPRVAWQRLGLVIIDEQQRFGVDQRQALIEGRADIPHFLSLTATPIPRSLALWLGGILTISSIAHKPPGRAAISTFVHGPEGRAEVDATIRTTIERRQQVYVITPLIDESDGLGVRAATSEHERLSELFPHHRVGLLHGAMPAQERLAILDRFRRHELEVLVSTTVIEVGVDVPNATLIVIEGAERFGLAQLHQLRGRVGRGTEASRCLFVSDRADPAIRQRLQRVAATDDGFAIAELDLAERGSGDLYGQRQSGLPTWQLASLSDHHIYERVQQLVSRLGTEEAARLLHDLGEDERTGAGFHPE